MVQVSDACPDAGDVAARFVTPAGGAVGIIVTKIEGLENEFTPSSEVYLAVIRIVRGTWLANPVN